MDENNQFDIMKIMDMAKVLGELLGRPNEQSNNQEVNNNTKKDNNNQENNNGNKQNQHIPVTYIPIKFDEQIQSQDLKIIKSVIPFMDIHQQKTVGVFVKLMEIKNILDIKEDTVLQAQSTNSSNTMYKDVLMAVKPHCSVEKQNTIEIILKLVEMKNILVQLEQLKEVL